MTTIRTRILRIAAAGGIIAGAAMLPAHAFAECNNYGGGSCGTASSVADVRPRGQRADVQRRAACRSPVATSSGSRSSVSAPSPAARRSCVPVAARPSASERTHASVRTASELRSDNRVDVRTAGRRGPPFSRPLALVRTCARRALTRARQLPPPSAAGGADVVARRVVVSRRDVGVGSGRRHRGRAAEAGAQACG